MKVYLIMNPEYKVHDISVYHDEAIFSAKLLSKDDYVFYVLEEELPGYDLELGE